MVTPRLPLYIKIGGLVATVGVVGFFALYSPKFLHVEYDHVAAKVDKEQPAVKPQTEKPKNAFIPTHLATPSPVKAIYMSQCVVGTKNFRDKLVKLIDDTEINSVVIDIKDFTGYISFDTDNPKIKDAVSTQCGATDMPQFIGELHDKGIYVVGRITSFQDPRMPKLRPELAVRKLSDGGVWKDYKGLSFIDVGAKEHWDYLATIAEEAYKIGFDEINFDYIRYPSDGDMKDTDFTLSRGKTKPEQLEEFFTYIHDRLHPQGIVISADLFGMVTTNHDDLGIGQVLERALPHFDYVAPMVYPSHYPKTFNGWADPNQHPYDLIKYVMTSAVERANAMDREQALASQPQVPPTNSTSPDASNIQTAQPPLKVEYTTYKKLRPWLQDFDYGGNYDIPEVRGQIQATYDSGLDSWMLWAPSNIYTAGALDPIGR